MRVWKRVLAIGLVATVLVGGGAVAAAGWLWNRAAISTVGEVDFANPVAIPPLAPSRVEDGVRRFDLTATAGEHDFGRGGTPTPTWGFDGSYLGPTLRARRGEQVAVDVRNTLPESTSVHWHGMRLPAAMDGGPHQPVDPGRTWSPTWRVDQPAATLWYHPHPHGRTEKHVYRGLAGMFLLDDDEADALDLPDEYGVDDIPVIVQDKRFDRSGKLTDGGGSFLNGIGILGDTIAVNGTVGPYLDVTTERVRLRLLNASTARSYYFGFSDDRPFALVGTDGGLLAAPHRTDRIRLSPAERAEIVVDLVPGERVVLRSYPPPLGATLGRFQGGADRFDVLQLRAAGTLDPGPELPERLVAVPRMDPAMAVQTRSFRLSNSQINGQKMELSRIDFAIIRGSLETWEVTNTDGLPHNFHVHDVQFQVATVDGRPPPPELAGWKDTVYLPPGVEFVLVARFSDHPDPDVPYMFHCHLLRHEDGGMMGQFVVIEPGQQPGTIDPHHDHG